MPQIVVVGSINMDLVIRTPRFPGPGETIAGRDFNTFHGGKGANQAVAMARLGADVTMIGKVGGDAFGERSLDALRQEGIQIDHIETVADSATGVAVIAVEDSGENRIIIAAGANGKVSASDVERMAAVIEDADILLLQLEVPLEAVRKAIEVAAGAGTQVVLNPAPAQELPEDLFKQVDVLIPNEHEAALLTGEDPSNPSGSAAALRSKGVGTVVVTLGKDGALILDSEGEERISSFPVPVKDTTAAGDAFVGSMVFALAQGKSVREATVRANAAGALAATKLGAQPSLPSREALNQFLQEKDIRL